MSCLLNNSKNPGQATELLTHLDDKVDGYEQVNMPDDDWDWVAGAADGHFSDNKSDIKHNE